MLAVAGAKAASVEKQFGGIPLSSNTIY